jgi:hypothetical protein
LGPKTKPKPDVAGIREEAGVTVARFAGLVLQVVIHSGDQGQYMNCPPPRTSLGGVRGSRPQLPQQRAQGSRALALIRKWRLGHLISCLQNQVDL